MTKRLGLLVTLTLAVACGGSTDFDDSSLGGRSTGGSATGGTANAGAGGKASAGTGAGGQQAGAAGKGGSTNGGGASGTGGTSSSGSSNGGSSNGGSNNGGRSNGGSSNGGSGGSGVDPRCPPTLPSGMCEDDQLQCKYDPISSCLCSPGTPGTFPCQKVDAMCPNDNGGTGGAMPAPPPAGSGGVYAKVAVPASQICVCRNGTWGCSYGI